MSSPIAFLNGAWIPAEQAQVRVTDSGFVMGITIAEQLRTFGGHVFGLDEHLARLMEGLETLDLAAPYSIAELSASVQQIAAHNRSLLRAEDDLGITIFVTPGIYAAYADETSPTTTCGIHTYPLPFRLWYQRYREGVDLRLVDVQQVSPACWPPSLKCRSRMHYYRADRETRRNFPGSTALLLDATGHITETPTSNVVAYFPDEELVSPPRDRILSGISLATVRRLAESLGFRWTERPLLPDELFRADEIMLTSTPYGMLPVAQYQGQRLAGAAGSRYQALMAAWCRDVDLDIVDQAEKLGPLALSERLDTHAPQS